MGKVRPSGPFPSPGGSLPGMQIDRRKQARPHLIKAAVGVLIAAVGVAIEALWKIEGKFGFDDRIGTLGVLVFVIGGVIVVRSAGRAVHAAAADRLQGKTKGTPISFLINAMGYLIVLIGAFSLTPVKPGSLIFGGALTGVMLGIAAQQVLGNFFAGIVLLLVRPFSVLDSVFLKGTLGEYEGTVTDMTLFYVHVETERGPVQLPNAGVLASAIGPGARPKVETQSEDEKDEPREAGPAAGGAPTTG